MTEIKADLGDLVKHSSDIHAAGLDLPMDANLNCGSSRGDGFDAFKRHVANLEKLVNRYSTLLDKDISALNKVPKNLEEADKRAASVLKGK